MGKYLRLKAGVERKNKLISAKARFLGSAEMQEPKRPPSAYFIFVSEKRPTLAKGIGLAEAAKALTELWKNRTAEEGKVFDDKAAELKKKYDEDMVAYKNSPAFKKFDRARKQVEGQAKP